MSQAIKKYLWLFEMIGAALILSLSIILLIFNQIILFVPNRWNRGPPAGTGPGFRNGHPGHSYTYPFR